MPVLRPSPITETICHRCFIRLFHSPTSRRTLATHAAVELPSSSSNPDISILSDSTVPPPPPSTLLEEASPPLLPKSPYRLAASCIISRPPIITRDLPPFEKEFYFYMRRIDKRSVQPFVRNFYFKEGTLAFAEWKQKRRTMRNYEPYEDKAWEDEMIYGAEYGDDEKIDYESLVKYTVSGEDISASDSEEEIAAKKVLDKPLPRETEADIKNDVRSLNRKLSRTLYLLVRRRREENAWKFPQANILEGQNLKQCAEKILTDSCGRDMNYWMVGNAPIAYYEYKYPAEIRQKREDESIGKKVFFMKARILAGRPNLEGNEADVDDYKWLTKDEIQGVVAKDYWTGIRHCLVER